MSVPISNVTRRVVFAPSGTGPYAFTFEILAATDIEVYKGDTLLTLTTDYTVSINANGTGSVTLVLTAGTDNITIVGARAIERTTDFVTGGDFFANTVNSELDSLTIFAQQNAEAVTRSIQAPVTDPTTIDMTLPTKANRAGKFLSFDTDGDPETINAVVDVTTLAGIAAAVTTVSGISAAVSTVAGIDAAVTNVSSVSSAVSNVSSISAAVSTVSGISADVTAVAGDATDIGLVAAVASDVAALGPIAADITAVAAVDTDVTAVAAVDTDVAALGPIAADITTVSGISADVTSVAGDAVDIGLVAGVASDVAVLSPIAADITAVSAVAAGVTALAAVDSDIAILSPIAADITAVSSVSANVTTVAGISADVTTVATNVADITNFSDVYLGPAAADPATRNDSSALQAGDLYFNTVSDVVKVYDGAAWVAAFASLAGALVATNNLSDLTDTSAARTNLGLSALATTTPGTNVATFLATPSSANLISAVTDETGTGLLVFATNPTLTGATMAGELACADQIVSRPTLKDYAIEGQAVGNTGATRTLDLNDANFFSATLDQACTFTFSDPPASGDFGAFVLELTNGGAFVATWPAAVDWPGGVAPTLTAAGVDQLVFTTRDAGTTYLGFVAGLDIKSP